MWRRVSIQLQQTLIRCRSDLKLNISVPIVQQISRNDVSSSNPISSYRTSFFFTRQFRSDDDTILSREKKKVKKVRPTGTGHEREDLEAELEAEGHVRKGPGKEVLFNGKTANQQKAEKKVEEGRRMNDKIKAEFVRLVIDDVKHEVVSRHEALDRARKLKMDLVEVDRLAKPPVCKIMDYHREMYKKRSKEKERAKIQAEGRVRKGPGKVVRFNGKTEQKDLQIKADTIKRMMDKGYRVKCMAVGTEDQDLGGLLARLSALIEDVAVIESGPRVEKKQAYVIVRHAKFGFKKGKKASKGTTSPTDNLNAGPSQGQGHVSDEELDDNVSHSESEDDFDSDEMETPSTSSNELPHVDLGENKMTWSLSDVNTDLETIFSFDNNKGVASSSVTRQTGSETGGVFPLEAVHNASLPYSKPGLPPVAQGPMQMDDNRYCGPTQMSENRYGGRTEVRSRFQSSDGVVSQKDVASASTPYSKPDPRCTNPKVSFLAQGPTQMDNNRYCGPTQTGENRYGGAAQVGENRYGGPTGRRFEPTEFTNSSSPQKDVANASIPYSKRDVGPRLIGGNRYGEPSEVRSSFQSTMSRERPAGNIKPSEFSPVYSSQFSRVPGALDRVQQGPESPYEGSQSQNNVSGYPPTERRPVRSDASPFRNSTQPSTVKIFKQEQSIPNAPGPQRPSYGIFSAPQHAAATRQSVATEVVGDGGNSTLKSSKTE